MNILRPLFISTLIGVAVCGCSPEPAPQADDPTESAVIAEDSLPAAPRPAPAPLSDNTVDLTFSGAITATLSGKAGRCSLRRSGPIPGATWQIRSEEALGVEPSFSLTIIAEPGAFTDPSIVVNVMGENRASFARRRGGGAGDERIALAEDAASADVDAELVLVGATSESVRVTGTLRCSAPLVTG